MRLIGSVSVLAFIPASQGPAQEAKTAYASMAPLAQYLIPRDAEISLARSAAPRSISDHAEILILTKSGFPSAETGNDCHAHRHRQNGSRCHELVLGAVFNEPLPPDFSGLKDALRR